MSEDKPMVGIFTMPQEFPCGKDAACCGPIGQSDEEVAALKASIEELGATVEVYNVKQPEVSQEHPHVSKLVRTFGVEVVPILAVGGEVMGMAFPSAEEATKAVQNKLDAIAASA